MGLLMFSVTLVVEVIFAVPRLDVAPFVELVRVIAPEVVISFVALASKTKSLFDVAFVDALPVIEIAPEVEVTAAA